MSERRPKIRTAERFTGRRGEWFESDSLGGGIQKVWLTPWHWSEIRRGGLAETHGIDTKGDLIRVRVEIAKILTRPQLETVAKDGGYIKWESGRVRRLMLKDGKVFEEPLFKDGDDVFEIPPQDEYPCRELQPGSLISLTDLL